ncbi:MAG: bifunctional 3-deoxy-7-phosphoheptulonate synthase/chorismate mutase type II [Crocinitomicaceae bacterium]|nr:bifunctional 3-deoxy-7-phosphoheptulonate synthase/chorismate mutase type II [Crocinitomicaceae bacterium]
MIPKNKCIIAGPCSAESREQVVSTAKSLAKIDSSIIYRAGIWKPRTSPGSFEGIGHKGLSWLKEVKETTGLKTATEVATPKHIEACLENDIDVLWIGARTTVNPFAIQELAEALRGTNKEILIKNPIHLDIKLWVGAFERMERCSVKNTKAIHRGFSDGSSGIYRNSPHWEQLKTFNNLIPEKDIICDPSHISGNALLVPSIAEKASKLNLNGLMIETHHDPSNALSDAKQQIKPEQLELLLNYLYEIPSELKMLRSEIDQTDEHLIELLARRMDISKKIAEVKHSNKLEIHQPNRWKSLQQRNKDIANNNQLDPAFIHTLYEIIHEASISTQKSI